MEATAQRGHATRQDDDQDEQEQDDDAQRDDDGREVRADGGVEVDVVVLLLVAANASRGRSPADHRGPITAGRAGSGCYPPADPDPWVRELDSEASPSPMAKRARGSSTRPGQRAPLQRSGPRPSAPAPTTPEAAAPRPANLTVEEEARAAELEAQILADEQAAAEAASARTRERSRRASGEPQSRAGSLAISASEEYGYVVRDVRRIAIIGAAQLLVLAILWAAIQATGFGPF